jgi:hypothetical protein
MGRVGVFWRVLIAIPGSQLCDSLDVSVQELELLPDDALRHTVTYFASVHCITAFFYYFSDVYCYLFIAALEFVTLVNGIALGILHAHTYREIKAAGCTHFST